MKTWTKQDLLTSVKAVWYLVDTEDEDGQDCVVRYDVKSLLAAELERSGVFTAETLDDAAAGEVDQYFYGDSLEQAFALATLSSTAKGEITTDAFMQAQCFGLDIEHFTAVAKAITIALGVADQVPAGLYSAACIDECTPLYVAEAVDAPLLE